MSVLIEGLDVVDMRNVVGGRCDEKAADKIPQRTDQLENAGSLKQSSTFATPHKHISWTHSKIPNGM